MSNPVVPPPHRAEQKQVKKLGALGGIRHMGTLAAGCRAAGVSRTTLRAWREEDEDFAAGILIALEDYRDSLSEEITRRGRDGYEEPVIHQGNLCYRLNYDGSLMLDDDFEPMILTVKKHSDKLLELNAKAYDDRYRDKSSLEVTGQGGGPVDHNITIRFVRPGEDKEPSSTDESNERDPLE